MPLVQADAQAIPLEDQSVQCVVTSLHRHPQRLPCTCAADTVPCIVLDPFAGSGTVGLVCRDLGRLGVCCDLKLEYLHMARERIG